MKCRAILVCIALAGCAATPAPLPAPAPQPVCAPLRAWSEADLKALGHALEPIPENSPIMRMALDWRRYYGDAKACAAK